MKYTQLRNLIRLLIQEEKTIPDNLLIEPEEKDEEGQLEFSAGGVAGAATNIKQKSRKRN
jgi:hypothetical protein